MEAIMIYFKFMTQKDERKWVAPYKTGTIYPSNKWKARYIGVGILNKLYILGFYKRR